MSTTTNFQLTLLEVGQKEKEVTLNTNFALLDQRVPKYLGDLAVDPSTSGVAAGSTYFNTQLGKIKTLKTNGGWALGDGTVTNLTWDGLSGKPTTLAGYSIEDDVDAKIAAISSFDTLSIDIATIQNELIIDGSAKIALESTGNYGWNDLISNFIVKDTSGLNNPTWGTLFGGLQGYLFSTTSMQQVWCDFHIVHDIALNTVLYPHIHWTPTTTDVGVVRWGIEYSVAKGHQQSSGSVFPATTTVYVEQTIGAASQWKHFVAEVSQANAIPATNIEPDSVIKVRVFRDATHANDTYTGDVHAWQADIHYQVATLSTKNKAPNFYA